MRFITVGDLHIKYKALEEAEKQIPNCDKMIFLGDYLDEYKDKDGKPSNNTMFHFLKDVIQLKKDYPEKVILLLGNHDLQYWFYGTSTQSYTMCTGYRGNNIAWKIKNLILSEPGVMNLFQPIFQYKNYLWSHAGFTNTYFEKYIQPKLIKGVTFQDNIQRLFNIQDLDLFNVSVMRGGFYQRYESGFFWTDKTELIYDGLSIFNQIVGHSKVNDIETYPNLSNQTGYTSQQTTMTFCDCLDKKLKFYELEI